MIVGYYISGAGGIIPCRQPAGPLPVGIPAYGVGELCLPQNSANR
jgi:hypothetical protein